MKSINFTSFTSFYLDTIYDTCQSFYRKAKVLQFDYKYIDCRYYLLFSYDMPVALIIDTPEIKTFHLNNNVDESLLFSHTSLRHIKEFFRQFYNNEKVIKKDLKKCVKIDLNRFYNEVMI